MATTVITNTTGAGLAGHNGASSLGINPAYTINSSTVATNTATWNTPGATLELRGEDADIVINGVALSATLKAIQDRLNLLVPNPELESEWEELRKLGELYREKEAEFKEKSRMWKILKK